MIPELHRIAERGDDEALLTAAMTGFDDEAASGLAGARFRQPSWGEGWDVTSPGARARYDGESQRVVPGDPLTLTARTGQSVAATIDAFEDIDLAEGQVLGARVTTAGAFRLRFTDGSELTAPGTVSWCVSETCKCPDESLPHGFEDARPGTGTISATALGTAAGVGRIQIELTALCGEDDDPPFRGGGRFVGTWIATDGGIQRLLDRIFARMREETGTAVLYSGEGQVVLEFREDGTASLHYENVKMHTNAGGIVLDFVIDGGGDLRYRIDGNNIRFTGQSLDISVTIGGEPMVFTSDDVPLGAPSEVLATPGPTSDVLVLTERSVDARLPNDWRRRR